MVAIQAITLNVPLAENFSLGAKELGTTRTIDAMTVGGRYKHRFGRGKALWINPHGNKNFAINYKRYYR
jgi:hypothetical protein